MRFLTIAVAGLALVAGPAPSSAAADTNARQEAPVPDPATALKSAIARQARGATRNFYADRDYRPLWVDKGLVGSDAQILLRYLDEAALDGLKPSRYRPDRLRAAIARADSGSPDDLARAEVALSDTLTRYVRDARKVGKLDIEFADPGLKPQRPDAEQILRVAGMARSFHDHVASMGWMSPLYVRTRGLLKTALDQKLDRHVVDTIRLNRERARVLPPPTVRHIVVDAASARLWYYQAGGEAGTMKVVVGARETQTPMLVGSLNYAILNPYWNVPDYLVRDNVAKKILAGRTLASMHMEVLSDWSANPARVDPSTVDWAAIAANRQMVRVRELPGAHNSMGAVKFVFPNDEGIYLHDTPNRDLFDKDDRHFSNGCIRLEKAWVLGEWMMGKTLRAQAKKAGAEQPIPMTATIPVYLTYITAVPTKGGVGILPDVYGRDRGKR